MPTVIIAAYNEASVIRDTLGSLIGGCESGDYQIIVACNGCHDGTEKIIQQEFRSAICISLKKASKSLAIRHVESLSPGFPRLYLDADITIKSTDAKRLLNIANKHLKPALIVPGSSVTTQNSQRAVQRFYKTWYNTGFVQRLGYGSGAYLLNHAGRKRFNEWPQLISDDGFVRSQFKQSEIFIIDSLKVKVKAPLTTSILIKVKARSKLGNLELNRFLKKHESSFLNYQTHKNKNKCDVKTDNASTLIDILTYRLINIAALLLARWQSFKGHYSWSRDNSTR